MKVSDHHPTILRMRKEVDEAEASGDVTPGEIGVSRRLIQNLADQLDNPGLVYEAPDLCEHGVLEWCSICQEAKA